MASVVTRASRKYVINISSFDKILGVFVKYMQKFKQSVKFKIKKNLNVNLFYML